MFQVINCYNKVIYCLNHLFPSKRTRRFVSDMSRCFIKFPIGGFMRTQYITPIGLFYKNGDFTWRLSDCEVLVVPPEEASRDKCD